VKRLDDKLLLVDIHLIESKGALDSERGAPEDSARALRRAAAPAPAHLGLCPPHLTRLGADRSAPRAAQPAEGARGADGGSHGCKRNLRAAGCSERD
jgi:hypothetical protein